MEASVGFLFRFFCSDLFVDPVDIRKIYAAGGSYNLQCIVSYFHCFIYLGILIGQ